jgi:hypothetical protein
VIYGGAPNRIARDGDNHGKDRIAARAHSSLPLAFLHRMGSR